MTNQELLKIIYSIASEIGKKPKYVLVASEFLVNLIASVKNKNLITDFENNFHIYRTPCYDINIYIEHMFEGYRAILYKDDVVILTIDEQGNGKIFEL